MDDISNGVSSQEIMRLMGTVILIEEMFMYIIYHGITGDHYALLRGCLYSTGDMYQ